ncbi:hypothetical protein BGX31_004201 [Mortierella sp. GBA43]|nr:hypothetical protein BGX31_004201 [Mortierella sp. GBA43]
MSSYGTSTTSHTHVRRVEEGQPLLNGVPVETHSTFYGRTVRHVHHHRKKYFALWVLAALAAIGIVLGLYFYEKGSGSKVFSDLAEATGKKPGQCQSDRSYPIALLLSIFFGYVGIDRFYLGYIITALLKLITAGGLGIWYIVDIIIIAIGALPDHNGCALVAP